MDPHEQQQGHRKVVLALERSLAALSDLITHFLFASQLKLVSKQTSAQMYFFFPLTELQSNALIYILLHLSSYLKKMGKIGVQPIRNANNATIKKKKNGKKCKIS